MDLHRSYIAPRSELPQEEVVENIVASCTSSPEWFQTHVTGIFSFLKKNLLQVVAWHGVSRYRATLR